MSISTIRRQVKNVAYNFSDAQVKVREATSNDPWRPSTALMSQIADLTHNPMAFTEIMSIVWKRLNDSGKNWRHVDKSLVLLDFLIKCGHEKVAQQCRENVFTIETLKDFQYVEDNRDQGMSIREKAKQITALLADEERLKNERTRAILTKNKFDKSNTAMGAETARPRRNAPSSSNVPGYEDVLPSTATEEEMQLQIALALSKEESEKQEEERKSDEVRLQMALEESKKEADRLATTAQGTVSSGQLTQSALDDLLSLGVGELVSGTGQPSSSGTWNNAGMVDPWGVPQQPTNGGFANNDQLFGSAAPANDPWGTGAQPAAPPTSGTSDPFAAWGAPPPAPASNAPVDPFGDLLTPTTSLPSKPTNSTNGARKTPEHFLGENASLVNMDDLFGTAAPTQPGSNPFLTNVAPPANPNPFAAQQRKTPTLNEMRAAQGQAPPVPSTAPRGSLPQADPFANLF